MLHSAPDRADHALIFEFVKAAARGGKDQNREPGVPEDQQFHIAPQARGMPLVVLAVHEIGSAPGRGDLRSCGFLIL
jgi:hypothetical protein